MSAQGDAPGAVEQIVRDLLPEVNEGFNWDLVTERYDSDPVGTAMTIHFTDEEGSDAVESVHLGISEGPEIVMLDELDPRWDYIGAIVTKQGVGLRILRPNDPMTPERARWQYRQVAIHPAEGESRERVWMVCSKVLDVMLETVIWRQQSEGGE